MTDTEKALQLHLDNHPDDWQCRLVLADHLEEIGDERADGYRALGLLKKYPHHIVGNHPADWIWTLVPVNGEPSALAKDWLGCLWGDSSYVSPYWPAQANSSDRRCVEDHTATAFMRLPERRRQELLQQEVLYVTG
jgi:uncharacterized protein (TIGR02996 family)